MSSPALQDSCAAPLRGLRRWRPTSRRDRHDRLHQRRLRRGQDDRRPPATGADRAKPPVRPRGDRFAVPAILRHVAPVDDFQDYAEWRALTIDAARQIRAHRDHAQLMPMTVLRHDYFTEITNGLRAIDADLRLLRLTASEATLRDRILARPEAEGPHDWALSHLSAALEAMADPRFGAEVKTDARTPTEVVDLAVAAIEHQFHGRLL